MGNSNELIKVPCPFSFSHKPLIWLVEKKNRMCDNCYVQNKICRWHCIECNYYFCISCKQPFFNQTKCPAHHRLIYQEIEYHRCMNCKQYIFKLGWRDANCKFNICVDCLSHLEIFKIEIQNSVSLQEIMNPYENYLREKNNNHHNLDLNYIVPIIIENNSRIVERMQLPQQIVKNLSKISERCILESDSYLFASCLFSGLDKVFLRFVFSFISMIIALIYSPIALIRRQCDYIILSIYSFFHIFGVFLLLSFLMLPPLLVCITQILAIYEILVEIEYKIDISQMNFVFLKFLIIWIFNCMVSFETSQAIKVLAVLFKKISVVKCRDCCNIDHECVCPIFLICYWPTVLPQFIQIIVSLSISFASTAIIFDTDTILDLIQNFAGLYILLELDNLVMKFLKIINFKHIFIYISSFTFFDATLKKNFNSLKLYTYMNQILNGDNVVVEEDEQKYLKMWEENMNLAKLIIIFVVLSILQIIFFTL